MGNAVQAIYLVDLAAEIVFQIAPEEAEVGRWDAEARRLVFDDPPPEPEPEAAGGEPHDSCWWSGLHPSDDLSNGSCGQAGATVAK